MSARRRGDDNSMDGWVAQCLFRIFCNLHIGKMSVHFLQSGSIAVDDPDDFAALFVVEIPNKVWPPLASPNHRHANHCHSGRRRLALQRSTVPATKKSRSAPGHPWVNRSEPLRLK